MSAFLNTRLFLLLTFLTSITSCFAQVKMSISTDTLTVQKTSTTAPAKMTRKQGAYSYMTCTGPCSDTLVSITSILEDQQGMIWVATKGEGVYCYDGRSFTNFTMKNGLISNVVYSLLEDKEGNIWLGTIGGASCYNGKTFTSFPFSLIQGNNLPFIQTNTTGVKPEVWSLLQDKSGNIWFGTSEGLYCYNGSSFKNVLELGNAGTRGLDLRFVQSLIQDQKGNIWFTSWAGALCCFDGTAITSFKAEVASCSHLLEDRSGAIWISKRGDGGVYCYNGKEVKSLFSGIIINDMREDKDGNIWFCTFPRDKHPGGIIRYNPSASEIISHFTSKDGLSSNKVFSAAIDRSGKVWFGTAGLTLSRYDPLISPRCESAFTIFLSE